MRRASELRPGEGVVRLLKEDEPQGAHRCAWKEAMHEGH